MKCAASDVVSGEPGRAAKVSHTFCSVDEAPSMVRWPRTGPPTTQHNTTRFCRLCRVVPINEASSSLHSLSGPPCLS